MSFISIGERAYKYIRQFTIKSIDDALIELITNCNDAYNKTHIVNRVFFIDLYDDNKVIVRDHALGLTSDGLNKCFLQVGDYTSTENSRGFFSRGAKDISALGTITFDTIRDGNYSQCRLDSDAYGQITIADIPVTDDIRTTQQIPDGINGLNVSIDLLQNFQSLDANKIYNSVCGLAVLRDIVVNPHNEIHVRKYVNGVLSSDQIATYVYPSGTQILDMKYDIPNYPDESARFVVYKADKPINQPINEACLEFGFLIKDVNTIYEDSMVDNKYRWNPYMNYLYGYIETDSIRKYLIDYDLNGSSTKNPYPVIDPSRLSGVNKMHPLITNLFSIPTVRIDAILRELNSSVSSQTVTIDDINELLDELQKYGLNIIQTNNININYAPTYDGILAKAIADDRAAYVTYEQSYQLTTTYTCVDTQLDSYVSQQIIQMGVPDAYYYVDPSKLLVQIQDRSPGDTPGPINVIELLTSQQITDLQNHPYVYKLSENGSNVEKLYIYSKGNVDTVTTSDNEKFIMQNKQFQIQFINDINISERYIIDNTNGIIIKLNLNNPLVSKYLTNHNATDLGELVSLEVVSNPQSLYFLQDLITNILADIIVQSDIQNGVIQIDNSATADQSSNTMRIINYRNKIITNIETYVDAMFAKYIEKLKANKMTAIQSNIDDIKTAIFNGTDISTNSANGTIIDDLAQMVNNLKDTIQNSI